MKVHLDETTDFTKQVESLRLELERCQRELDECRKRMGKLEQAEALLAGENRLLEMVAKGEPLPSILDGICLLVEKISSGSLCSILLLDPNDNLLRHGAAPSLPASYISAFGGKAIGPTAGPCGRATYFRKPVIVSDIAADPLGGEYRDLALAHGFQACWSTPILSSEGKALGSFAVLSHEPRGPTPQHQRIIAQITHLAAAAIERKHTEQDLRRSEAYLAEAQKLSRTGSFGWKVSTGELVWSDETFCIMGYDRTIKPTLELVLKRVHPEDASLVQQTIDRATREESDFDFEHRLLMPDAAVKHLHVVARATKAESGAIEFVGAVMDITERKLSQEAMRAAKARFEGILEIADDAIISVDSKQHIVLFNQGAEKVFGYAQTEVIGKSLDLLLPQRFAQAHRSHIEKFAKTAEISRSMAQRSAVFGRRKDGSEFPAEASISKLDLGNEILFTVILRDITEQKRLENRLRQSEKNLAEGQRLTKTGSWILDYHTGNTDWSVETCRIFGFPDPPPSPHYSEFRTRVRPEDREGVDRGLRESFETGEPRPLKYIFTLPDGTRKNIETISQPFKDAAGELKLMGTVMDVTERTQAAEALRASEKLARGQVEALTRTLDMLAMESAPDRLVEHVLRTIAKQLGAHSCSVWQRVEASKVIDFQFSFEDGRFVTKSDSVLAGISLKLPMEEFWPWSAVFCTGKPGLMEDIRELPLFPWQERLISLGVITILIVPMSIAGRVDAVIGVRFTQKRVFSTDELELAQALANQAMLAMQLTRLSAESRESAVIAERNRMARDIHDTHAQGFTGVIMQLEAAKGATTQGDLAEAANRIERAGELARTSLGEARRSVRALRLRSLQDGTLCVALNDLLKRMSDGTDLRAEFQTQGDQRAMPAEWEENLLRITQESLTNAIKHAKARNFRATLSFGEKEIQLQLADDGRGFDLQAEHEGFGLIGMRERADRMNGKFILRSRPGEGTEILVILNNPTILKSGNGNEQA